MDSLTCKCCHAISEQFSILKCDHVVCAECLWGQLRTSLAGTNSLRCPCGQTTSFSSKSILTSPYATANISSCGSPRRAKSNYRPLKTEVVAMSSMKKSRLEEKGTQTGKGGLSRELEFLGIQFRKEIEEVQRNFNIIVENMQKKFEQLVTNIKLFWLEEIVQSEPLHLLNLSKLLQRKYHKSIGHRLKNLNETLIANLANFRTTTEQSDRLEVQKAKTGKQNRQALDNQMRQRQKLLTAIQQLKDGHGLRKMTRKNSKYRFA